ncbi:MAG: hypothetical protein REI96_15105 [Flavobacterium nitrogenifigens]|uniref:Uncharacterized protein n=1 Tax=Flavobacterium nitrogenifigens TaxID=1617283 RepID=A0A521DX99_9FLAO|nr:hypothetical protein [Flavobacterium nitrogenifigens]KAF2334022.1 hypothetical protein DM397_08930 [Flavobacterium nitrogenifigens]MDQ8013779.1 hypothetical protein [Flavobacterium nitrogenifigens]SMO76275.1 hypothetical protein SAMN06265220_103592 [Flavobacterium nitrogenifigens]
MKQYHYQNNILNLQVKKTPFLIRAILFLIAFMLFVFPVGGTIFGIALGNGLHIGYFIGIGICFLIGFYTLRIALWNTYGNETIQILEDKVIYEANYGWFKDGKKEILISNPNFYAVPAGYEEDNEGVLIIGSDDAKVESVVKIKMIQLEELASLLQSSTK